MDAGARVVAQEEPATSKLNRPALLMRSVLLTIVAGALLLRLDVPLVAAVLGGIGITVALLLVFALVTAGLRGVARDRALAAIDEEPSRERDVFIGDLDTASRKLASSSLGRRSALPNFPVVELDRSSLRVHGTTSTWQIESSDFRGASIATVHERMFVRRGVKFEYESDAQARSITLFPEFPDATKGFRATTNSDLDRLLDLYGRADDRPDD